MALSPFDIINSINQTKEDLLEDPENEKKYNAFIVNRGLSYFPDTVFYANEMNRFHFLDKKLQYDFLMKSIPKKKRFSKWAKKDVESDVEMLKELYGYSQKKCLDVIRTISEEQMSTLREMFDKGGRKKNTK